MFAVKIHDVASKDTKLINKDIRYEQTIIKSRAEDTC